MPGFFANLFEQRALDITNVPESLWRSNSVALSSAGLSVTPESALRAVAVFACVRVLAESEAMLPLLIYRKAGDVRSRAENHPLYRILKELPNPEMSAFNFRSTLTGHTVLRGNGFAEIAWDNAGRITGLWPLRPDKMQLVRERGELVYIYTLPDAYNRDPKLFAAERILHLRGLGSNGLWGFNPIELARQAVGLSLATEQFGAQFFGNGARPGGVLMHPSELGDKAYKRLKENWESRHQGLDNAQRVAILEEGMKYEQIGIPPEDAQFLETRKYQNTEIARLFRVPPHMIADLERATFSNIEEMGQEFISYSLGPYLINWEQEIYRQLLLDAERGSIYAEHLVSALVRGDIQKRYAAYAVGRQWGWLSTNDVRRLENLNPVDGGDEYLVPLNMIPAGSGGGLRSLQILDNEDLQRQTLARALGIPAERLQAPSERIQQLEAVRADDPDQIQRRQIAAAQRHRIYAANMRIFEDIAKRILRRERNDVSAAAKKMLGSRPVGEFESWMADFYEQEHSKFAAEQMMPAMMAYAELIAGAVGDETGSSLDAQDLENFVRSYAEQFGKRHALKNLYKLRERLEARLADPAEDQIQEITDRLDQWVEDQPAEIAQAESAQQNNAIAKAIYLAVGVIRLVSVAMGAESCPYCRHLDGKVVGITEYFLQGGADFQPEGAERPLKVSSNKGHAPYHAGCDCMTMAA